MAGDDLNALRKDLPDLFLKRKIPEEWDGEWIFEPVGNIEEDHLGLENIEDHANSRDELSLVPVNPSVVLPPVPGEPFPGYPQESSAIAPPPDALAFYLPFHYFHPLWWGIYLMIDGIDSLATYLRRESGICYGTASRVARMFLYGHEIFHHKAEVYAVRMEIAYRKPLYRFDFESAYQQDPGMEEAPAEAYAYDFVKRKVFLKPNDQEKRKQVLAALKAYIESSPSDYKRGAKMLTRSRLAKEEGKLAEEYFNKAFPSLPSLSHDSWRCFSHAFSGMIRIKSRVNYVLHKNSDLAERLSLGGRFISHQKLSKKLKNEGCEFVRQGKGSHEIWKGPNGQFSMPRHPRDLKKGTVRSILKDAGLPFSLSELVL
jgi:predicted RNA binding protein YcfA (HicA-like mRNA interferase family)